MESSLFSAVAPSASGMTIGRNDGHWTLNSASRVLVIASCKRFSDVSFASYSLSLRLHASTQSCSLQLGQPWACNRIARVLQAKQSTTRQMTLWIKSLHAPYRFTCSTRISRAASHALTDALIQSSIGRLDFISNLEIVGDFDWRLKRKGPTNPRRAPKPSGADGPLHEHPDGLPSGEAGQGS